MSDMMSAIQDDIDHYILLCSKYNEDVVYTRNFYGVSTVDAYGEHAKELLDRDGASK